MQVHVSSDPDWVKGFEDVLDWIPKGYNVPTSNNDHENQNNVNPPNHPNKVTPPKCIADVPKIAEKIFQSLKDFFGHLQLLKNNENQENLLRSREDLVKQNSLSDLRGTIFTEIYYLNKELKKLSSLTLLGSTYHEEPKSLFSSGSEQYRRDIPHKSAILNANISQNKFESYLQAAIKIQLEVLKVQLLIKSLIINLFPELRLGDQIDKFVSTNKEKIAALNITLDNLTSHEFVGELKKISDLADELFIQQQMALSKKVQKNDTSAEKYFEPKEKWKWGVVVLAITVAIVAIKYFFFPTVREEYWLKA